MISTEALLTSRDGFGIATATPAQRAACRILDGRPLGDLRDHPGVSTLVGGPDALASLPSERGIAPTEVVFLASIRSAKTIVACAAAIRMTQTVDVSRLGPGEIPRVSIVSLKLDTSAVARSILTGTIRNSAALAPLLIDDMGDGITVRHPTGRPVELVCVAGGRAGGGLVARWSAGVIFDEAPRMSGESDAIVNLDHARSAVLGRLLPGAQALYIGSAWAPHGPIYDMVQEHWQRPTEHMVVLRGSGPMLNPTWWTPERCDALQAADPVAFATDVLGEFADPESGLLNPISLRANTREAPLELVPERGATYACAIDPSGGAVGANGWTCVIVQVIRDDADEPRKRFRVACAREWRGMRPEHCIEAVAAVCQSYRLSSAITDQFAGAAHQDLAHRYGLSLVVVATTARSKLEDFTNLATLVHSDCVELPPDKVFQRDLLSVRKRLTQQGATIVLPRTADGRHCDYAPALAAAITAAGEAFHPDERLVIGVRSARSDPDDPRFRRRIRR